MELLLMVHSIVRWFIVIVGLLAALKFFIGWRGQKSFQGMDRGLSAAFSGLIDLQALLGLFHYLYSLIFFLLGITTPLIESGLNNNLQKRTTLLCLTAVALIMQFQRVSSSFRSRKVVAMERKLRASKKVVFAPK